MSLLALVVDDDDTFRKAIASGLNKKGYETLMAKSGQEAFQIIESNGKIDLVISDWKMENGDGLELLSKIKKGPHRSIGFILMSGAVSMDELLGAVIHGPNAVILKPFDFATLCQKIELVTKKK